MFGYCVEEDDQENIVVEEEEPECGEDVLA